MRARALAVVLVVVGGTVWAVTDNVPLAPNPADLARYGIVAPVGTSSPAPPPMPAPPPEVQRGEGRPLLPPDLVPPEPPEPRPVAVRRGDLAPVLFRVPTRQRVVFLTIDDGWERDPRVVDLIRRTRLRVSMFLVRRAVEEDPEFFRGLVRAGARVQAHTSLHQVVRGKGAATQRKEICRPSEDLRRMLGERPTMFRPPDGKFDDTTRRVVASCGLNAVVMWSGVMSRGKLRLFGRAMRPGDIILLHFRKSLYRDLAEMIRELRRQGYAAAYLEDYLTPPV